MMSWCGENESQGSVSHSTKCSTGTRSPAKKANLSLELVGVPWILGDDEERTVDHGCQLRGREGQACTNQAAPVGRRTGGRQVGFGGQDQRGGHVADSGENGPRIIEQPPTKKGTKQRLRPLGFFPGDGL